MGVNVNFTTEFIRLPTNRSVVGRIKSLKIRWNSSITLVKTAVRVRKNSMVNQKKKNNNYDS